MTDPNPDDRNPVDITPADAAEINAISHPLLADPASDDDARLVQINSSPDGVVTVTINRPRSATPLTPQPSRPCARRSRRCTGPTTCGWCSCAAQADVQRRGGPGWMRDAADWSESDNRDDAMGLARMLKALHDVPALTCAIVEGAAMGGGAGIVAACDMAVAVEGARFAFSEVKLGLIPATISPLCRRGRGRSPGPPAVPQRQHLRRRLCRPCWPDHMILPEGSVDEFMSMLTDSITANAPDAMGDAKRLVHHVAGHKIDNGLMDDTAKRIARARVSAEGQEGVRAFLEKRKPKWAE